jgi:glycosyltransferase involved in cell wall biosynthesis
MGYTILPNHGRFYAIPGFLDPEEMQHDGRLTTHPAILSAPSRPELEALIRDCDPDACEQQRIESFEGYQLIAYRGRAYGVPDAARAVDLDVDEERFHAGVICGTTCDDVRERIRTRHGGRAVEFAGWLPIFETWGNCGRHPQFTHIAEPPPGYRFTCSAPPKRKRSAIWRRTTAWLARAAGCVGRLALGFGRMIVKLVQLVTGGNPLERLRVLAAMIRLFFRLVHSGARLPAVLRFIKTRHYQSQLLLGRARGLVFLTSMPYTYGQSPWVIEIEDPTTLFYPLIQNGATYHVRIANSPYFPAVKAHLESDQCRAILTHIKSTADMIPRLFGSDKITAKVRYTPLGVKLPARWQRHDDSEHIDLVFINSWCQVPGNLFVRGGLDILEAFAILHRLYPQLRLTLRTHLPVLDPHYHRLIESCWVRVIDRFLSADELETLLADSHIFLLPAARIHVVSLLQAMSYGLAVVASDGWGIQEYVTHERNGLIVKGRYGKVSWVDEEAGMLREDYEPMYTPDPRVVEGLVEAVSRLVEDRALRQRLGRTARLDVETTYNLERWNAGLKEALDQALSPKR